MAMKPLSATTQTELAHASSSGLAIVFDSLRTNLAANDWLRGTNSYRINCIQQITEDLIPTSVQGLVRPDLAEYIAASAPLHCADGWTFLARSLSSYINGNPHQAAHFGYYAELRAAMSILAAQGIGVFNRKHFIIDRTAHCRGPISGGPGTHEFAWLALDFWANTTSSGSTLLNLFTVSGISIRDWFNSLPGSTVASSLGSDWLRNWGLDLRTVDTDHDVRNLASYRPNVFTVWDTDARSCSEFLRSMWALLEPSTTRFETLDSHLLRTLVRKVILESGDPNDPNRQTKMEQQLSDMLDALPLGDPEREGLGRFLRSTDPESSFLSMAGSGGGPNDGRVHERVMARAALLLRVASGFSAQLIDASVFTSADLRFWTDSWGTRRAFWMPGEVLEDFTDLWMDVSAAIDDERNWMTGRDLEPLSMHQWRLQRDETIRPLTECDRVALWGLRR
jgi:hypothetical protein